MAREKGTSSLQLEKSGRPPAPSCADNQKHCTAHAKGGKSADPSEKCAELSQRWNMKSQNDLLRIFVAAKTLHKVVGRGLLDIGMPYG